MNSAGEQILKDLVGFGSAKQRQIIGEIGPVLLETLGRYGIDTPLRIAHFLGQCCKESDRFSTTEEYASGAAYEGRLDLGNDAPGDGVKHKGYGLIQTTGKTNQHRAADYFGIPRESVMEYLKTPIGGLESACLFWRDKNLNRLADVDDVVGVTKVVNGGTNGLKDRAQFTADAKIAIAHFMPGSTAHPNAQRLLHRGVSGDDVTALQRALRGVGYALAVDSDFGPATEVAVKHYQEKNNLVADGIVGPATAALLRL